MTSFRSRIRWTTLAVFAALLLIFSAAVYVSLSHVLYRHVDDALLALARSEADHLEGETGHFQRVMGGEDDEAIDHETDERDAYERHELQEAIRESVVIAPDGAILWKGEAVGTLAQMPSDLWARALNGETVFDSYRLPDAPPFRRISLPIRIDGRIRYILQTQTSLQFVDDTLRGLIAILGGLAIVILSLAWGGSEWIARAALVPVNTLGRAATTISERNLGTRVYLDAPYTEFQQFVQSFNAMLERLHTVFESQRRFVADAAHELKTPLTAIKGNLEVALSRARTIEEYRETLAAILGEVDRLTTLVRSLLMLAQYAGARPIFRERLDVRALLQEVLDNLSVLAEEKGCQIMAELREVPRIHGDAGQLKQLMINLVDNAVQHAGDKGRITIRLRSEHDQVVMQVEDTGPGIGAEHLPHIFDRFYRVDTSRDRSRGGAGLGLAIAKDIVEAHGGTIRVQSTIGQGTIFTVRLPIAQ